MRYVFSNKIYIIIGEEIITTDNHPFYLQGRGFIDAGNLLVDDKLISVNGENLLVENYKIELAEGSISVYNFQVEDYHTYFVGNCAVWVHNAECSKQQILENNRKNGERAQEERHKELLKTNPETKKEITIRPYDDNGNLVDYNVRVDELNNDFFNEVKASESAPYTKNQKKGCELLQRNGGVIRGAGKPGFKGGTKLDPIPGYTTRNGKTVPISQDLALYGGGK